MFQSRIIIVVWILVIFLGMIMIFSPQGFLLTLIIGIGVVSVLNGLYNAFYLARLLDDKSFKNMILFRGTVSIIAGIAAILAPRFFAAAVWTVIMYCVAAELILSSIIMLLAIGKLKADEKPYRGYYYEAAVSLFLALVLFAVPAAVGLTLIRVAGILIVLTSIFALIWVIRNRKEL
ncbi:MAG: DUF308 domain-containing protein [Spirochaetales bacterium]|jgi:uncharacterized membrane protein HdeD (DUF308 family)|nr:DUF308 domain-containing protein [Spirochaetales bacterium]